MEARDLSRFIVRPEQTVREAMQAINENWRELAVVADASMCVQGVITDGDIRRGLLSGLTMDSPALA